MKKAKDNKTGTQKSNSNDAFDFIREDIKSMHAYHVPNAEGMVKLDAMENPFAFPAEMHERWLAEISKASLNRYPDPSAAKLRKQIRKHLSLPEEFEILLGNGSDELIQLLITAIAGNDACVLSPEPSFVMYKMISQFIRVKYIGVDLKADFQLDVEAMLNAVDQYKPELLFIAQPNNPTSNVFTESDLIALIEASTGYVVIDEAYTAFTDYDAKHLMEEYENVLILRTFSKVGLAGLRLGFLLGRKQVIHEIDKIRLPYNIGSLTQVSAEFALKNFNELNSQAEVLKQNRKILISELNIIETCEAFESETNFVVVRFENANATTIFEGLKARKILVKNLDGSHPLLNNCLRFTVGKESENSKLIEALRDCL